MDDTREVVTRSWKGRKQSGAGRAAMAGLWYFKQDIFIPSCRREWFSSICYGRKLRDPAGAVRLTGPSPGQPAVHPLSRLDRPAVTHSAVKPWAEGFEMWQHNQFPWFMITPKGGRAERLGSWKRRREGECWQQQSTTMYSSGDSLLLAARLLFVRSSRIHNNNVRLYWSRWGNSLFTEGSPEKSQSSGSATVQRSTLELTVIQIQIHEDYDARNHLHCFVLELQRFCIKYKSPTAVSATKSIM